MSQVKTGLEQTIASIVEAMLPRGSGEQKCLNVTAVPVSMNNSK